LGKFWDDWGIGVAWSAIAQRAEDVDAEGDWESGALSSPTALPVEYELYPDGDRLPSDDELDAEGDWLLHVDPTAADRQGAGEHGMGSLGATPTADTPHASGPLDAGGVLSARGALGGEQVQRDADRAIAMAAAVVTWVGAWAGAEAGPGVDHQSRQDLLCGDELEALCPQSGMGLVRCLAARRDELSPRCLATMPMPALRWGRAHDARASAECAPAENALVMLLLVLLILWCIVPRRSDMAPTAASVSPAHVATCTELPCVRKLEHG